MKISNVIKDYENLFEALKFTNADRSKLGELKKYFKIGIEYEFLVDEVTEEEEDFSEAEAHYSSQADDEAGSRVIEEFKSSHMVDLLASIEEYADDVNRLKSAITRCINEFRYSSWLRKAIFQINEKIGEALRELIDADEPTQELINDLKNSIYNFTSNGTLEYDDIVEDLTNELEETSAFEYQKEQESSELFSEYMENHRRTHSNKKDMNEKAVKYAIDDISYELGDDYDELIEEITEDGSLEGGAEVVSNPLDFDRMEQLMSFMFKWIKQHGSTDNSCGMHVNISHASFVHDSRPNPLKIFVLMDVDFFQNVKGALHGKLKYPPRGSYAEPISKYISENIKEIAKEYIKSGIEGVEHAISQRLINSPRKYMAANWTSFFDNKDAERRRIEFRFFGGTNYHERKDEIINDIIYIMHVIHTVFSGNYQREVYLKGLYKVLDSAAQRAYRVGFADLVSDVRNPKRRESREASAARKLKIDTINATRSNQKGEGEI